MHILRCMGSKFCVKFQRAPLQFHIKFLTHTPQNVHFIVFIFLRVSYDIFELWRHESKWDGPQGMLRCFCHFYIEYLTVQLSKDRGLNFEGKMCSAPFTFHEWDLCAVF